ncbi:aminoglycoside phosphotransferase family protein [Kitasatospora sp. NBC_01250]|uniref:aminoglycoside phosphotransferase family protein n=1 Tax=Kitasatospora sp. NBC_01250 TaxID=2903571 RepID=UPI002E376DFE|nr:aminoglycoside phosphotransferase family protein [Kitasatospora sp. NBC_01250]
MIDATADTPLLPPPLQRWLADRLPELEAVTDVSWPRDSSRVWRLSTPAGAAFAKISPSVEDYQREVYAYEHVAGVLADHEAPRLLSADPHLRALLTTPLPGRVVRDLPLEPRAEQRAHELAGQLLRRWHDHPVTDPDQVRGRIVASATAQADEASRCLERTAGQLTDDQYALVEQVVHELPALAEQLPIVYQHGDFSPRNWLWDESAESLGLIDFQLSAHGSAVGDLIWLHGALWPIRPDLKDAFFTGFARDLTDAERRALPLLTTRLAVSYLTTGLTVDNAMLIDRGRAVLARLVEAHG